MIQEFKAFLMKGNVMDLAVGIIIGAAFTAIVNSLVGDLIDPIIGLVMAGVNFSDMFIDLSGTNPASLAAAKEAGAAVFAYGAFITAIINFVIIGFVVFMLVKMMNKMMAKKEEAPAAPAGPSEVDLLKDILAALKK
ncbi:MAG: large conductance mechanosensitive channel protein MscL [Alphaproteobacteria bacterium]|nr:large conductance mechanosensitive channel protein MscL [Alphaproteobacteria bacterium]